jgi:hypothetical protein
MTTPDGSGLILILIFAALFFGVLFLVFKRKSSGILGNRFLLLGATAVLVIFFFMARGAMVTLYQQMFKPLPYDFSEFKSIVFEYGENDSLVNQYNSATGEYQYLDRSNSLIKTHLYLTATDLLYLHRKAAESGFWDFPSKEINTDTTNNNGVKPTEYLVELNYQHKTKKVLFSTNYEGPPELIEANRLFIKEIQDILSQAGERQKK